MLNNIIVLLGMCVKIFSNEDHGYMILLHVGYIILFEPVPAVSFMLSARKRTLLKNILCQPWMGNFRLNLRLYAFAMEIFTMQI